MSDPHVPGQDNQYADLEIRKRPLVIFLILTLLVTALTAVAMWALLTFYLADEEQARQPVNVFATERILPTNYVLQGSGEALAALDRLRQQEDAVIGRYAWVNKQGGTVRIPVERAMERLVEKGLPVRDTDGPDEPSEPGDVSE